LTRTLKKYLEERGSFNSRTAKLVNRLAREYVEYQVSYSKVAKQGVVKISDKTSGEYIVMR